GVDLLRLPQRHARVVGAVLDEERRADPLDVRDRRGLDEEVAVALQRPVLRLPRGPPPRRRVLEEGDEVRDADALDPGRPSLRLPQLVERNVTWKLRDAPQRAGVDVDRPDVAGIRG